VRLLFLNQYFPPDPAPTGVLFDELGSFLKDHGHNVQYIAADQDYRVRKKGTRRLLRELRGLTSILLRGWRADSTDVVISGSSPPCLLPVATLVAAKHRARSIHWLMDMYPDLAVALGEFRGGGVVRGIERVMGWSYRRAEIVALDADMAKRLKKYCVSAHIVAPWIPNALIPSDVESEPPATQPWTWIYSGNLGRAHEWLTLLQTQAELERRNVPVRLLFQGSGPVWNAARNKAAELGLKRCEWSGYVPQKELRRSLLSAHVTVATQRPETCGLLWPSKLALLLDLPRPILWVGPTDSAIANKLRERGNGVFAPGDVTGVADWLEDQFNKSVFLPHIRAGREEKNASLQKWLDILSPAL
jgi:colanic acid biosynthesis glycosyl transferase WcaI